MVAAVQQQEAVDHHLGRPAVRTNNRATAGTATRSDVVVPQKHGTLLAQGGCRMCATFAARASLIASLALIRLGDLAATSLNQPPATGRWCCLMASRCL